MSSAFFDEIYDGLYGIAQMTLLHLLDERSSVLVSPRDGLIKGIIGYRFFRENRAEALFFKRFGIEELVSPAGSC